MKPSLKQKLLSVEVNYHDIGLQLSDPKVINDQNKFRDLSREFSRLEPIIQCFKRYLETEEAIEGANSMKDDPEMAELAEEELARLKPELEKFDEQLKILLLPQDPDDNRNVYLEVRAGTGGDEAAIFAGDLFRMYQRYAELEGWKVEIMSSHDGEHGGYKEIIAKITGTDVYARLKFESGAHRVQRVPNTETQGRIHTSACTIAILPELEDVENIEINPADIKTDTYRSSGAGGQHVNTTDSAVRVTHIPTGIVVECQDERSQHKNRAKALSLLGSRIIAAKRAKQQEEQAKTRRSLVGSGDRSERIRTYNFPQGRVTDHRINLTLYKLDTIMQGYLSPVIEPLIREHQADLLAAFGDND